MPGARTTVARVARVGRIVLAADRRTLNLFLRRTITRRPPNANRLRYARSPDCPVDGAARSWPPSRSCQWVMKASIKAKSFPIQD
jgi:hypothetical protein